MSRQLKWLTLYFQFLFWLFFNANSFRFIKSIKTFYALDLNTNLVEADYNRRNLWDESQQPTFPHSLVNSSTSPTWSTKIKQSPKNFIWFKEYWILHQSKNNFQYTINRNFKTLFFICNDNSGIYNVIGIEKFYQRWTTGLNLVFNLSFFNANITSFANKTFIEESLVYNWSVYLMTYKMFRFSQNVIYFKDVSYGEDSKLMYEDSQLIKTDASIITDVKGHEKNIFFLRTFNVYRFGLIPANFNPWLLTFPIPLLGDSLLGQYYFFGVVIQMTSLAKGERYNQIFSQWKSLTTFLKLSQQSPYVYKLKN